MYSTSHNLLIPQYLAYSIISLKFTDCREVYLGYCSTAMGLGLMLGPVLGQIIFTKLGFQGTFFFFAVV
jgi:predicted MFS family arabinose efflux permease